MSNFTTQVRFICESITGHTESQDYTKIDEIVTQASPLIFANYPIADETHRLELNKKILKHYYTREICEETYALWKLRLNARMEEIMPYYNKMYESEQMLYGVNPLNDVDLETISNTETEASNSSSNYGNSDNKYSDTPQGSLAGVESSSYLTNYAKAEYNGNESGEAENETNYTENVKGKSAGKSYSVLIKEYRDAIINIDKMIIEELSDLFFGLWE